MALSPNQALAQQKIFRSQLAFGQIAETDIARWLLRRGNVLLPIYEKEIDNGKGPRIFLPTDERVAPDLLILKGSYGLRWIEAKHKKVFSWYRIGSRWTTGIDIHHYHQYCLVRDEIGIPIWLLFLHECSTPDSRDLEYGCPPECPTGLFGENLDKLRLETSISHTSDRWGRTGMVYWAHDTLRALATLDEVRRVREVERR